MAQITFTINDNKLAEFKEGFLKRCPVPTDPVGTPLMTESQWIKEWGKREYFKMYREGKRKLAAEQAESDEGIIA